MQDRDAAWRGIAIGPILFIIAIMAVLVTALSSGMGDFGNNATVDRIKSDVRGQANLIRAKVQECYMTTMGSTNFGFPDGPAPGGTLVKDMACPGDPTGAQNLWSGARPTSLPPTPTGFNDWVYLNYERGRCLLLKPKEDKPSTAMQEGLTATAKFFGAKEVFLAKNADWSLSIWLTPLDIPVRCGS